MFDSILGTPILLFQSEKVLPERLFLQCKGVMPSSSCFFLFKFVNPQSQHGFKKKRKKAKRKTASLDYPDELFDQLYTAFSENEKNKKSKTMVDEKLPANFSLLLSLPQELLTKSLLGLRFPELLTLSRASPNEEFKKLIKNQLYEIAAHQYPKVLDQKQLLCDYAFNEGQFCSNITSPPSLLGPTIACQEYCKEKAKQPLYRIRLLFS